MNNDLSAHGLNDVEALLLVDQDLGLQLRPAAVFPEHQV